MFPPVLADLALVCAQHRVREKWLVAPSRRVGQQWLDRLALAGTPVLNVHVFSLRNLARQLASPALAGESARATAVVADDEAAWWLELAWQTLPAKRRGRLTSLPISPALATAVARSLHDLRMAGLTPANVRSAPLPVDLADVADKPRELADLWEHFDHLLQKHGRCDSAALFALAEQQLQRNSRGLPRDVLLMAPAGLEQWKAEQTLLAAAGDPLVRLGGAKPAPHTSDLAVLPYLLNITEAPMPKLDGTVTAFRAIGEANEVRAVFRRLLAEELPLDRVEVLVTDPQSYVPLLIDLAQSWRPDETLSELPLTFAGGLPAAYTRPGRALRQWLRWVDEGFPQQVLIDLYQETLFDNLPGQGKRQQHAQRVKHRPLRGSERARIVVTCRQFAKLLRETPIGRGHERYMPALDRRIAALRAQLRSARTAEGESEPEDERGRAAFHPRLRLRLLRLRLLRRHVKHLLALAPDFGNAASSLHRVEEFLSRQVRRDSRMDTAARRHLRVKVEEALNWLAVARPKHWNARRWIEQLLEQTHVHDEGPRPGAVHVSPVLSGGQSGRDRLFVLGMDDTRFPGLGLQDPVLLDEEREALSGDLPLGADQPRRRLEQLVELFERLPRASRITFSCVARSLDEDREMFPSPPLQTILALSQCRDEAWELPASFIPARSEIAVTEFEWWLRRLSNAGETPLWLRHPHYRDGRRAWDARRGSQPTRFNGLVPEAAAHLSPLIHFTSLEGRQSEPSQGWSASAMETAGACPLRFFFRYGLKVRPPEELMADEDRWLDPLQFGSLMHDVFRRFMSHCANRQELPDFELHHHTLAKQLGEALEEEKLLHPPPSESAFRQQARMMQIACGVFLDEEQRHCQELQPRFFEAVIGWGDEDPCALQVSEPLPIPIGEGRELLAWGQVDRVDQRRDDAQAFEVWDYKTGRSNRYDVGKPFSRGQHVQNIFYTLLVQAALQKQIDPAARVVRFGYFFPGVSTWGARVAWPTEALSNGPAVLRMLADVMGSGAYLPTWSDKDCTYCDYVSVCGPQLYSIVKSSATQAEQAQGDAAQRLAAWRELQNVK